MLALLLAASVELASPQALFWYDQLLAEGGYGRFERERAAFLIREADGTLTLEPWMHGDFRHASFRGAIPSRTIAILHTHPANLPRPSARDRAEARRLGIAVVVITPSGAIAAMADGTVWSAAAKPPLSDARQDR
ncbi:MAG: Mov34/MPN/PAD-1 family protein [Thermoanaerobaculia bacterium]